MQRDGAGPPSSDASYSGFVFFDGRVSLSSFVHWARLIASARAELVM